MHPHSRERQKEVLRDQLYDQLREMNVGTEAAHSMAYGVPPGFAE